MILKNPNTSCNEQSELKCLGASLLFQIQLKNRDDFRLEHICTYVGLAFKMSPPSSQSSSQIIGLLDPIILELVSKPLKKTQMP